MSQHQEQHQVADEAAIEYSKHLIWRLIGSTITSFGANEEGEILLTTVTKSGERQELIIGLDEQGEIAIFEVEQPGAEAGQGEGA